MIYVPKIYVEISSSKKVVPSGPLQISIPEWACCKRTIMKNCTKCQICNKVYHPSRASVCPMSENINENISNESSQQELLLKIIYELVKRQKMIYSRRIMIC